MTKHLQIFLLNILLILGISCTTDTEITNSPNPKINITITLETTADIDARKYEVGLKTIDGKNIVDSRKAVSTSYTFSVNSGKYILYALAYDDNENIIGKAEKETSVSDGDKISLTISPMKITANFTVLPSIAITSNITQVKISVDDIDYYLPYTPNQPIVFDKFTKEGTYELTISFVDKNKIAYFETSETVTVSEISIERDIEPEQIKVTPVLFNFESDSIISLTDKITISCDTKDATVYYTVDGTTPSQNSTFYNGTITIPTDATTITIKAIAFVDGLKSSEIETLTLNIDENKISAPVISPESCTFESLQTVQITHENENVKIFYTTDGTEPTNESAKYTGEFNIFDTTTIKAIASLGNGNNSSVVTVVFTLQPGTLPIPQISEDNSTITLSCNDPVAEIYYTTDDSTPTISSTKYSAPFPINYQDKDIIVKAKAFRTNFTPSETAEKIFECTCTVSTPEITITPSSGSIASSKTFIIQIDSDAVLTSGCVQINGKSIDLHRGKNEFRVSDFASIEGTKLTIRAEVENRTGSNSKSATLTIADPKLTGKFNELRIYQVMVEAFQSGNSLGFYQGYGPSRHDGDIEGIINALDYIKGLGMNALWLTPVFNTNAKTQLAATGYYAYDYFDIDPNFGTKADFERLVDECHKRNMYIILDGVFGHWSGLGCKPSPSGLAPQRSHGMYDGCDYPGKDNCTLEFFKEVATYWIKNYKIDGWRLDQCYQAGLGNSSAGDGCYTNGHNYWYEIREAVEEAANANGTPGTDWGSLGYMVGEHWNGDDSYPPIIQKFSVKPGTAAGYGLRSCFDFPSRYKLVQMFAVEESKNVKNTSLKNLDYVFKSATDKGYYHPSNDVRADNYVPNLFLTNHDIMRFGDLVTWRYDDEKSDTNYWKRHKVALSTLAAYTGPITIYYGDEIGDKTNTTISSDNAARTQGRITDFTPEEQDLHDYVAKLMTIRNENEALWNGTYKKCFADDTFFVAEKSTSEQTIAYIVNYSNSSRSYNIGYNGTDLMTGDTTSSSVSVPALSVRFILKD